MSLSSQHMQRPQEKTLFYLYFFQSASVWGSMQDLTWGKDDYEKGEGSAQNYTGWAC